MITPMQEFIETLEMARGAEMPKWIKDSFLEKERQQIIEAYDYHRVIGNYENGQEYYNAKFGEPQK